MSTFVLGDIHGCKRTLDALLAKLGVELGRDTLWLVGDLVNGGGHSLEVLRWARDHEDHIRCVLGNHDLHLLAVHHGVRKLKRKDDFGDVLEADDVDALMGYIRRQPLFYREGGHMMVHAGLLPHWSTERAEMLSEEIVEQMASDTGCSELMGRMYGDTPARDADDLDQTSRQRLTINVMTRMRTVSRDTGELAFDYKGPLHALPPQLEAWFHLPHQRAGQLYFGHWSALRATDLGTPQILCLDEGVRWGHELAARDLASGEQISQARLEPMPS